MKDRVLLGSLEVGTVPLVVGVISSDRTLSEAADSASNDFDVAELRLDLFGGETDSWLERAHKLEQGGTPVILTLRSEREGGRWKGTIEERAAIYREAVPWVSAVDCEIDRAGLEQIAAIAHGSRRAVVGSYHDFKGEANIHRMNGMVREGRTRGADIVKLAQTIRGDADVENLLEIVKRRTEMHICILGMGEKAAGTRVSFALEGSCLTYGYVGEPTVQGQPPAAELRAKLADASPAYRDFMASRRAT